MASSPESSPSLSSPPPSVATNANSPTVHPSQTTKRIVSRFPVERCFLINLDRREDRLREWMQQLPQPWPLPEPERFAAIDGRRVATPPQWRAGNGAWGCYRSHLLILEKCLLEGIESYVVFEDDAGFREGFVERFRKAKHTVWKWREDYPGIQIKIRQSHRGWMRQYHIENGKPTPFNSNPNVAFKVCMQKTCTQLYRGLLWKCPALAYFAQLESKLNLHEIAAWKLFRDYKACRPNATEAELQSFIETKAIPQCGLCPSKRKAFVHPDPTQQSVLH